MPFMTAAIALGTNLGDRTTNLRLALDHLATLGTLTAASTFHDTAPVGYLNQPHFLNAAALLETDLPPKNLLQSLLSIEKQMGRDRSTAPPKGPRLIDLDLLLYGNEVLQTPDLTLPHPTMQDRAFVLTPLAEIAPNLLHPTLHRTIFELLQSLTPNS
jgi:2-amino-4-hydroxy-6-hydroxymethyldihydropteridine diphosphokinase